MLCIDKIDSIFVRLTLTITMRNLFIVVLFLIATTLFSQEITSKIASENFNQGDFNLALKNYLELAKQEPENVKYNYRIGVCYLNTNIDKAKAVSYLEKALKSEEADPNTGYLLGRAYHFAYRFNDAIKMYEQFKSANKGNPENLLDVEKQIEYCYNAIELMKFPLDVSFKNLGANINSKYKDYYPFVAKDESFLIFNSKRDDGSSKQPDGTFTSEVYFSKTKNGELGKVRKLDQNINTLTGNEEIVGMSPDGDYLIFYFENEKNFGDLFIAEFENEEVKNLQKLPKSINSKHHEIAASISKNGDAIYFASDRDGGFGGVDLYISLKLPNGEWGPAQNLGPSINTPFDEDFPNITADGKSLFFSSKGHTSMGGYDIFKASWDNVKRIWTDIKNVGFPINTPEDNTNFRESESGRTGYISALRAEGMGNYDIYAVTFNEVEPEYTVIKGFVTTQDTSNIIKDVFISVLDLQTDELYGSYLTNPISGRYIIILPPGRYNILVEVPGYKMYSEDVEILGKSDFRGSIKKDIILKQD